MLSDVILNQKAATEGPNQTLDFIPGSCFLGIVASQYEALQNDGKAMEIFHSGKVRFGDAHPSKDGFRGLKVPAVMFHPKLEKASEVLYIHHKTKELESEKMREKLSQNGIKYDITAMTDPFVAGRKGQTYNQAAGVDSVSIATAMKKLIE